MNLDEQIRTCTRCPELAATRTTVVVGDTPPQAALLVLGEAPGAEEDQTGRPFVGRSGKLLDALLAECGIERHQVAVLNTIKCRPPGNRVPTREETANCRPWTEAQLDLQQPRITVTLGLSATRWLLKTATLSAGRGSVHEVDGRKVLPTYHPAAALRGGPNGEPMARLREDLARAVEAGPVRLQTVEDTKRFGEQLGRQLQPGDLVILSGPLGAGKTALTQGIGKGLGITSPITSPTFVIARVHDGPKRLIHVDAYRLTGHLDDLGIDEDLDQAVVVVEWGEGVVEGLADSHLLISMQRHDDDSRTVHVTGVGPRWESRSVTRSTQ